MSSSRGRRRVSVAGFIGDLVDDTKEFVDDLLDRDDDDRDPDRRATRRPARHDDGQDLAELRDELDQLGRRIERLTQAQPARETQQKSK